MRNILARLERGTNPTVEVAARIGAETPRDFWEVDMSPCWQMCHCPPQIRDECPAYTNRSLPCWEIEGTYCKLTMEGGQVTGRDTTICQVCRVYKKYGEGKPIEIKLRGVGIDTVANAIL